MVIIDEATQALEAVRHILTPAEDGFYIRFRSAGYPYSRLRSSSSRATPNNFLLRSIHYPHRRASLNVKALQRRAVRVPTRIR